MQSPAISTRSLRVLRMSVALSILMAGSWSLSAGNLSFMQDAPTRYFTQEDRDLMMKNANEVLDSQDPKASQEWVNPKTGNSGGATLRGQFTATDGASCRKLKVSNTVKKGDIKNAATYVLCKYEGRGWVLHPDAEPAPASPK